MLVRIVILTVADLIDQRNGGRRKKTVEAKTKRRRICVVLDDLESPSEF